MQWARSSSNRPAWSLCKSLWCLETAFRYASSESREQGHQGRSSTKQWKLPKPEQVTAMNAAKELGITNAEFVRLSIIWLQQGIRNNSITSIEKCQIISGDKVAPMEQRKPWKAAKRASCESEASPAGSSAALRLHEWDKSWWAIPKKWRNPVDASKYASSYWSEIADFNEAQDQWFEDLLDGDSIEDIKSQMAFSFMRNFKVDWDTAILLLRIIF